MIGADTVAELLNRPERWCRGAYARNCIGAPVSIHDVDAESWCLAGALEKVYGIEWALPGCRLADAIAPGKLWRERQTNADFIAGLPSDGSAWEAVSNWSEAPGRTWEEVRELVERVGV